MEHKILRAVELVNAAVSIERSRYGGNHLQAVYKVHEWIKLETGIDIDETMTNDSASKIIDLFNSRPSGIKYEWMAV